MNMKATCLRLGVAAWAAAGAASVTVALHLFVQVHDLLAQFADGAAVVNAALLVPAHQGAELGQPVLLQHSLPRVLRIALLLSM